MKFILLVEMSSSLSLSKRIIIKRELESASYGKPKRNVFLLELENERAIKAIKKFIVLHSDENSKVNYYRLYEE